MVKGGKSLGSSAHWQPVAARYWIAFHTSRRSVVRGQPTLLGVGMNGATSARSASCSRLRTVANVGHAAGE